MAQSQNVLARLDRAIRSGTAPRRLARSCPAKTHIVRVSRSEAWYHTVWIAAPRLLIIASNSRRVA